jgi:Golgi phosphoprotein 3 (GPP34)
VDRLPTELVLLALDETAGRIRGGRPDLDYALAGAVLLDLALEGRVTLDGARVAAGGGLTGDPILDDALARVTGERRRRPKAWVPTLSRGLRRRLVERLVLAGTLSTERVRMLWVFPAIRYRYPPGRLSAGAAIARRVAAAVDGVGAPDPRTAALCGLVRVAGLDRRLFPDRPRRQTRRRLDEVAPTTGRSPPPARPSATRSPRRPARQPQGRSAVSPPPAPRRP